MACLKMLCLLTLVSCYEIQNYMKMLLCILLNQSWLNWIKGHFKNSLWRDCPSPLYPNLSRAFCFAMTDKRYWQTNQKMTVCSLVSAMWMRHSEFLDEALVAETREPLLKCVWEPSSASAAGAAPAVGLSSGSLRACWPSPVPFLQPRAHSSLCFTAVNRCAWRGECLWLRLGHRHCQELLFGDARRSDREEVGLACRYLCNAFGRVRQDAASPG